MTVAQFSRDDILLYGAREEAREEGRILGTIDTLRQLDFNDEQIVQHIMKQFGLNEEEANKYIL